jgi:hypothetical protein
VTVARESTCFGSYRFNKNRAKRNLAMKKNHIRLHRSFVAVILGLVSIASAAIAARFGTTVWSAPRVVRSQSAADPTADFIFSLSITTNEIIYNSNDHLLYATRPSRIGSDGNSIIRIDPLNGQIAGSVYVGSEPNKMAVADDGQTMYVTLDGAYAVRRYDAASQTPGQQFSLGRGPSVNAEDAPYSASDIKVVPGDPNRLAVARSHPGISPPGGGVAVFNNGVQLPLVAGSSESPFSIAFSSPTTLQGGTFYDGLRTMTVTDSGVAYDQSPPTSFPVKSIKYENGLLFDSGGRVIDPVARTLRGTCPGVNTDAFVPETATGRVFYAVKDNSSSNIKVRAFDTNTFLEIGVIEIPNTSGDFLLTTLLRYGSNGLALRTTDDHIYFIQTSLIPTGDPLPTPSTTPSSTPTPVPTPFATFVRTLHLPNKDMLYRQSDQQFYVSVPSVAGTPTGNTLTRIDPSTGILSASVPVGSEPGRLGLSDDEQTLYLGIDGDHAVRRYDMQTQMPGSQFALGTGVNGPKTAYDIDILPNDPNAVAVSYGNTSYNYDGADIYDNGVKRSRKADASGTINIASPQTLYVGENYISKYSIGANGLTLQERFTSGGFGGSRLIGDLLYTSGGTVVNVITKEFLGSYVGAGWMPGMAVDAPNNRIFFLTHDEAAPPNWLIKAYRLDNYLPIGSIPLPGIRMAPETPSPYRLIRWGTNGLAFNDMAENVYFVQSHLVSTTGVVPTAIRLDTANYQIAEDGRTVSIPILRNGGLDQISSVQYATVDGSATGGSDFGAVSGTVTFQPGESVKTIDISINDDNIYEAGPESFSFVLSNVTSGGPVELQDPAAATITITDNDPFPYASVPQIYVREPRRGTSTAYFTVRLNSALTQTASLSYRTADATAIAGSDYVATSGVVTFQPLETVKTIPVEVLSDENYTEPVEYFQLLLSDPVNIGIFSTFTTAVINNYDPSTARPVAFDYDNDGKADISVFRPESGAWYLQQSYSGLAGTQFGISTDRPTPADYDGDGKTDIAVYRPGTGIWYILRSSDGSVEYRYFGVQEDLPTPADYDGDRKADISVYRPSTGTWYRQNSSDGSFFARAFGTFEDKPVQSDFDGDSRADIAVYRPSSGTWYYVRSTNGTVVGRQYGNSTDIPAPADYDGDGRTDTAVFRPATGVWYIRNSFQLQESIIPFGVDGDVPAVADFDGDGLADLTLFRPSDGNWYGLASANGAFSAYHFGANGDLPTEASFTY